MKSINLMKEYGKEGKLPLYLCIQISMKEDIFIDYNNLQHLLFIPLTHNRNY